MYGTVARFQVKPDAELRLADEMRAFERANVPGALATYLYRMDTEPSVYYMAVLFADKASYVANAESPQQDARYRKVRELLTADPEWHDGEVVYALETAMRGR